MSADLTLAALSYDLGKRLTHEVAAEELPYFDEIVRIADAPSTEADHTLGFGSEAAMVVVSGFLVGASKVVIGFLWEHGKDAAGELVKEMTKQAQLVLTEKFKLWLSSATSDQRAPVTLAEADIDALTETIDQQVTRNGLSATQRSQLKSTLLKFFGGNHDQQRALRKS